jgi:hypothetical protein
MHGTETKPPTNKTQGKHIVWGGIDDESGMACDVA